MQADGKSTPAFRGFKIVCSAGAAGLAGLVLASCSTSSDPFSQVGLVAQPGYQQQAAARTAEAKAAPANAFAVAEDDPALPDQVAPKPSYADGTEPAAVPEQPVQLASAAAPETDEAVLAARMGADGAYLESTPAVTTTPGASRPAPRRRNFFSALFAKPEQRRAPPQHIQQPAVVAPTEIAVAEQASPVEEPQAEGSAEVAALDSPDPTAVAQPTAYVENRPPEAVPQAPARRRGFLSAFFSSSEPAAAPTPKKPEPVVLASAQPGQVSAAKFYSDGVLPGVRDSDNLYEIKRKSGSSDHSDIDINENNDVELALAPGFARLAPNGLTIQTDRVDVGCLKPSLVRVLKAVEQHYGEKVVVTSGYRSPQHNKRARGSRNSLHMYCAAADIQVAGIGKWELAQYLRSMPGRGGVGTYCHTKSVHIDVGPERDWNWRCRRRKRK